MTRQAEEELEGITLSVYAYLVKKGGPAGTRDVTRGAGLSSTSVAFRHLQKLEALGLIRRNEYGDYVVMEKAAVRGYLWLGKSLVPRLLFYSFFFMGALAAEVVFVLWTLLIGGSYPDIAFLYLIVVTGISMILFLVESFSLHKRAGQEASPEA